VLFAGLLALNATFWVTTMLSEFVPDERIVATLLEGSASGAWDLSGRLTEYGSPPDRFTECVAFTQGLGLVGMGDNRLERAMADGHLAPLGCADIVSRLQATLLPGSAEASPSFRYWHGYVLVTRPLLALADMYTVRALAAACLVASIAFFLMTLIRPLGVWAGVAFIAPLLLTSDLPSLPSSIPHALSWTVAFCSAGLATIAAQKWGYWGTSAIAMYAGAVFVFMDLFLNPPGALALVIAGALTGCAIAGRSLTTAWRMSAVVGASWAFGYSASWVMKWLISALAFGFPRVEAEIQGMIAFRLSGSYATVQDRVGAAIIANWRAWIGSSALVISVLLACLVLSVLLLGRTAVAGRAEPAWVLPYAATATIPALWYEVVSNHSQIHAWFTYRSLPVSLSVLMLGVVVALKKPTLPDRAPADFTASAAPAARPS
jgi:hypothetical protein